MKGDFTRSTFKKEKHFHDVRMQQGRVQLDSDWNEQQDISAFRVEAEAADVIGTSGAPHDFAGFGVEPGKDNNSMLFITKGNYYVNGILCQNEPPDGQINIQFTGQPDIWEGLPSKASNYLAYLDVWEHHITALEDPDIREVALEGPDTATRTKTIWQVKLTGILDTFKCSDELDKWKSDIPHTTGKLAAQVQEDIPSADPCNLVASGGYRGLENRLYRVEVHKEGNRKDARFKWSRDNGSVVAKWEKQDSTRLTVSNPGRDYLLKFKQDQWVELTDDRHELNGDPGLLVRIKNVEENVLIIDDAHGVDINDFGPNAKIRRWDSAGEIKVTNNNAIDLEDGIQVKFSDAYYKTGDYWLIPARTEIPGIEWPKNVTESEFQLPEGIKHNYAKLAILNFDGTAWKLISDCRKIFPPVTSLINIFYVSGDGQETMPSNTGPLPEILRVRISNGNIPAPESRVRFTVSGGGKIYPDSPQIGNDGIAECSWTLGEQDQAQTVTAELLNCDGDPIPGQKIIFRANFSVAGKVGYTPECEYLRKQNISNVHEALEALCNRELGGGCAVKVSPRDDLAKKLSELIEQQKKNQNIDISICLAPGDYVMKNSFDDVNNLLTKLNKNGNIVHIKIVGCGQGSRIHIRETSFSLTSLTSLILRDICIMLDNPIIETAVSFLDIKDLEVTYCHFKGQLDQKLVALKIFAGKNGSHTQLTNNKFSIYTDKKETLPGNALALMDANADTFIYNNQIFGSVSLYGLHEETLKPIPDDAYQKIINNRVNFGDKQAEHEFRFCNNQVTRVIISDNLVKELIQFVDQLLLTPTATNLKSINFNFGSPPLFLRSSFIENSIEEAENHFLAQSLHLTSNSFGVKSAPIAGVAIGGSAIYTGNLALNNDNVKSGVKFYNLTSSNVGAANLNLDFIPHLASD